MTLLAQLDISAVPTLPVMSSRTVLFKVPKFSQIRRISQIRTHTCLQYLHVNLSYCMCVELLVVVHRWRQWQVVDDRQSRCVQMRFRIEQSVYRMAVMHARRGALQGGPIMTAQFESRLACYTMKLLPHTSDTYCVHVMCAMPECTRIIISSTYSTITKPN